MGKASRTKGERKEVAVQAVQENQERGAKTNRGKRLVVAGLLGAIVGGVGIYGLRNKSAELSDVAVVEAPVVKVAESVGEIEFRDAVRDRTLRQNYCDKVFENREQYGTEFWNSLESIEYDEGFNRARERLIDAGGSGEHHYGKGGGVGLATTMNLNKGGKNIAWVSEHAFRIGKGEDDFFSCLDNEASTAFYHETGRIHFTIPPCKNNSEQIMNKALELVSFDYQFEQILNGKRKVSDDYLERVSGMAKGFYSDLKELAESDVEDSECARILVDVIKNRSTRRFFE